MKIKNKLKKIKIQLLKGWIDKIKSKKKKKNTNHYYNE